MGSPHQAEEVFVKGSGWCTEEFKCEFKGMETNTQQSSHGVFLLFKNSASLPFAKGEEGLLPCLSL